MSKSTKIDSPVVQYENLKEEYEELEQIVNSVCNKKILLSKLIKFTNKIYCKGYSQCTKDYNL